MSVPEEWNGEDERRCQAEAPGSSPLDQLLAAEDEARLAEASAVHRAAGILGGRAAGSCNIEVRLPPPAEAFDEDEGMCLVDLDAGF